MYAYCMSIWVHGDYEVHSTCFTFTYTCFIRRDKIENDGKSTKFCIERSNIKMKDGPQRNGRKEAEMGSTSNEENERTRTTNNECMRSKGGIHNAPRRQRPFHM